jgi:hypothetical protein
VIRYARYQLGGGFESDIEAFVRANLASLIADIEEFRDSTGAYPASLSDLGDAREVRLRTFDPTFIRGVSPTRGQPLYYERLDDESYLLFARGPDGVPFSEDDIRPDPEPSAAPGYRHER